MASAPKSAIKTVDSVDATIARARRTTVAEAYPPRIALARGKPAAAVIMIALTAFGLLFGIVRARRSDRTDVAVTLALQRRRAPWFRATMHAVSWPGFPPQSRLIPPTLAAVWWILGFPIEAAFQGLAWGASGVSFLVKGAMRRPRPNRSQVAVAVARIGGSSFPSGHVLNYVSVYGFLAYGIATLCRPNRARRVIIGALAGLLALVGPSRIYLGHHWATDVSASYLLGTSYLLTLTALYRRTKLRLGRR